MLITFSGLPATGKTAIAKSLAEQLFAVYLRIDSIEQAVEKIIQQLPLIVSRN